MVAGLWRYATDTNIEADARKLVKQLFAAIALFLTGIVWVTASGTSEWIGTRIDSPFQRSGSVLVLVAVYLEYCFRESAIRSISLAVPRQPLDEKYGLMMTTSDLSPNLHGG